MKVFYYSKISATVDGADTFVQHRLQTGPFPGVEYKGKEIAIDPATGQPVARGLLVLLAETDHTPFQGDPQLIPIPMIDLDAAILTMGTEPKLVLRAAFVALGFGQSEVDTLWSNTNTLRQALNTLGRENDPTFDVNAFDLTPF